jgi:hypothetical protein
MILQWTVLVITSIASPRGILLKESQVERFPRQLKKAPNLSSSVRATWQLSSVEFH